MRRLPLAQGALVVAAVLNLSNVCRAASPAFNAVDSMLQIRRDYLQGPLGQNDSAAPGLGAKISRVRHPVRMRHPTSFRPQLLFPKKRISSKARWLAGSNRQQSYPSREIPTSCLSLRAGSEPARFRNLVSGWCGIAVWRSPPSL